jgi:ABC-type branched-subunit amino acid transport system ATPase component/ABC-type branched-subunit amino acid transport system permease subunit
MPRPAPAGRVLRTPGRGQALRLLAAPVLAFALVAASFVVPKLTADPFLLSFVPTIVVAQLATLHVWLLLRVNLLSFASPAFMAVGAYTLALTASHVTTNAVVLVALSFLVPAVLALPLGALLLRLRGTYFALVTFVLAQVIVLIVVIGKGPLGGTSGISGIPAATVGASTFGAGGPLLRFSVVVGLIGVAVAGVVTLCWRRHFAAIDENEPLAASLGLRPWAYKTASFVTAAGVAGLAGLVLVNQLGNAHPDSFTPFSAVNHVAAAVVGGVPILGPVIGAVVLAWLVHTFASQAEYSQLLLGATLILVVLYARGGITGTLARGFGLVASRTPAATGRRRRAENVGLPPERDAAALNKSAEPAPDLPNEPILVVADLSRRFGGVAAVDGISFELKAGEIIGVIGPNGAGKTTLINMISGHIASSGGRVELDGRNLAGAPSHTMSRHGIARSYQQTSVFATVSVRENLARVKAFSPRWIEESELADLLAATGLLGRLDDRAGDLPYGLQKLLGLLLPIATRPRVLLLDEPAAGLERAERGRIDELVAWVVRRGCAVLLVEHDMDLVRRICPRVIVMETGRPLAAGVPEDVFADPKVITAYLGVSDEDELVPDALAGDDGADLAATTEPASTVGAAPTTTREDHHD